MKLMPFGYKDFFMIACPNWLVANDNNLPARSDALYHGNYGL